MRILFLDIDGVLNSHDWAVQECAKPEWQARVKADDEGFPFVQNHIDPQAVKVLDTVMDRWPDLHIVVSSTWRLSHPHPLIAQGLAHHGFRFAERVIDRTSHDGDMLCYRAELARYDHCRGTEIAQWLDAQPAQSVQGFVVLDDDSDWHTLGEHWVLTPHKTGLSESDKARIDAALVLPADGPWLYRGLQVGLRADREADKS